MNTRIRNILLSLAALSAMALGAGAIAEAGQSQSQPTAQVSEAADSSDAGDSDKAITGSALDQATKVALDETGGGKVTETEEGDEESYYEVEVTLGDGSQVDVQLDENFKVVGDKIDREEPGKR